MQTENPDDAFSPIVHDAALVGKIHEDDVLGPAFCYEQDEQKENASLHVFVCLMCVCNL